MPTKANTHLDVEPQHIAPEDVNIFPQDTVHAMHSVFCVAFLA